jgi:hypothetical protein
MPQRPALSGLPKISQGTVHVMERNLTDIRVGSIAIAKQATGDVSMI